MKLSAARITSELEKMKITLKKKKSAPKPAAYTMTPQKFLDAFVVRAVYVWAPQAYWPDLVGMPPCPFCKSNVKVKILSWPSYGPRRVHGLEGGFFLIGQVLRCTRCPGEKGGQNATFMNYDARVMALYPRSVQAKFPCYVTHKCAMDVKLVALLVLCVLNKMNFAAMARINDEEAAVEALADARGRCILCGNQNVHDTFNMVFFVFFLLSAQTASATTWRP